MLHLSRKTILANLTMWCTKMQPLSGNQRPDLLTSLMNTSLVRRLPREMHLCRSSWNVACLPSLLQLLENPTSDSHLTRCTIPCACHTKPHPNFKICSELGVFCVHFDSSVRFFDSSTSKSVPTLRCFVHSRRNGVHFFDISTSKNAPTLWCL